MEGMLDYLDERCTRQNDDGCKDFASTTMASFARSKVKYIGPSEDGTMGNMRGYLDMRYV